MSLWLLAVAPVVVFALAYRYYGGWLKKMLGLSSDAVTPAVKINDGQDYSPTQAPILLGQHFAAIAAVGPIAGPIIAGKSYGWLPAMLWIVVGAVLVGAVHDLMALTASVRHGARTVGEVFRQRLGGGAAKAFSVFIWLSLLYVILVFTDLTSSAFVSRPELGDLNFGPGVATSSFLYLGLACLMGLALKRGMPLRRATLLFVPLVFVIIWWGQKMPFAFAGEALLQQRKWNLVILAYCALSSVIPFWVLLQPRGYLGGFILYATFAVGIIGLAFGGARVEQPAFAPLGEGMSYFPLLFTTIACGAVSGFHGLVSSGTSSKQLAKETHAQLVGYGGMLLEGLVAVVAVATLVMVVPGSAELGLGPDEIYARGLAHMMQAFGIPFSAGVIFGKLAFATFIYDTLDVATRLGRYVWEEVFGLKGPHHAALATAATLAVPVLVTFVTFRDSSGQAMPLWKIFWPAFGASNQLLAALTLVGLTVWLKQEGKKWWVTGIPAVFMVAVTVSSLVVLSKPWLTSLAKGEWSFHPIGVSGVLMILLAGGFLFQAGKVFIVGPVTR